MELSEKIRHASDRLVLIGTTARSIKDLFYTPYCSKIFNSPDMMPGIVLHANIVSQILTAALDGRPLLRSWSKPMEWLGILALAGVGAIVSWWFKSSGAIAVSFLMVTSGLVGGIFQGLSVY